MEESQMVFPDEKAALDSNQNDTAEIVDSQSNEFYTVDEFLDKIGQLGKFQLIVLVLLACLVILAGYQAFFMQFATQSPSWQCSGLVPSECNSTEIYSFGKVGYEGRCSMNRTSWKYTTKKYFSIVTEFDLVCSREPLRHLATSALFIGEIIAGFPMAYISDHYGRKRVLLWSFLSLCVLSFVSSFSPNMWLLILLRILSGGSFVGIMITIVVVSLELVGPKFRTFAGLIFWNCWTVGLCLLSLQSWLLPEWKLLGILTSAPYLIFALGFLIIPESVRWYRSQNKIKEAESILRKVARVNGKTYPPNKRLSPVTENSEKGSYKHLFISLPEGLKTLALCWMWFTNDLNYYGISLASGDFGGNMHRDFVLFSICEIPANLLSIWFLEKFGRKRGTVIGYIVTSASLICFGFLKHFGVEIMPLWIALGITAKVFNIMTWGGTEVWSGELYPTSVRSQAMGLFFIISQIGSAVSPWIGQWLKNYSVSLPFFIFGGFPFVAGFLALRLEETRGLSIGDAVLGVDDETTSPLSELV